MTARDYNDNGWGFDYGTRTFQQNQHRYVQQAATYHNGWPGGKPNADDSTRPERALPYPKRVIVFSPHPDDDVISMGGTVARLSQQGHQLHVAYQTSGNIAVFDHEVIRFLDFLKDISPVYELDEEKTNNIFVQARIDLSKKKPGEPDTDSIRKVKGMIRRGEAKSACEYLGIEEKNVHFLDMPFYETGGIKKKPLTKEDIDILCALIDTIEPHQIFAAGDLSDPHGTHRICYKAILKAMDRLSDRPWFQDCRMWLYRGAWQEWDVPDVDMAVPLSPKKSLSKETPFSATKARKIPPCSRMIPGVWNGPRRETIAPPSCTTNWMAEYQAIEMFRLYRRV